MNTALVCDVGRDQVRFGLVELGDNTAPHSVEILSALDYPTFTDAVIAYLRKVDMTGRISQLALAVAGIPRGDSIGATNGRWRLSVSGLATYFSAAPLVLNDFAASAFALKSLSPLAFRPIGQRGALRPAADASFALIGPLDGLGVAGLLSQGGVDYVIQSEAGHSGLAPASPDAQAFLTNMLKTQRVIYAEHLLSEDGLKRAYSYFSKAGSVEISPVSVSQIILQAHADPASRSAVDLFTAQLAVFSRDIVTTFGTWGGVYFTGNLAKTLFDKISSPSFRSHFADSHIYSRLLREVPMGIIVQPDLALTGLAAAVRQRFA